MNKLNLMETFIAVVECHSYTAAALRLGKTKALVSTQVKQLEDYLQVRLISRSTRSLHITSAGERYYQHSKSLLESMQRVEQQLQQERQTLTGKLRISAPITYGEQVLMPLLAQLALQQPQLQIDVMLSDRYVDLISEGFEAAVRIGSLADSNLISKTIAYEPMLLLASSKLAQLPTNVGELAQYPAVFDSNSREHSYWEFNSAQGRERVSPPQQIRVNSAQACVNLLCHYPAIAYVPAFAATQALAQQQVVPILPQLEPLMLPVQVVYPHRAHISARLHHFIQFLQQQLPPTKRLR